MSRDFGDGYPTPASWLPEGAVLVYQNESGEWERFVVPPTLRLDEAGRLAAKKHMRESALGTTSRPLRWEGRS